tara:strand:+ start:275 stop:745 length:471 start_codon:yes stop_codon:yes gene_type:complete
MTTTLTAATLTVTVTEAVSLNGYDQGSKNTLTIASINEVNKRIVTVPASEIEVVAISTANASGTFIEGDVRYMRFTNLDDTNHLTLTFKNENDDEFAVKLDKGQSFIYNADSSGGVVDTMDGIDGTGLTLSLGDLVNVTALADTAACDLEIFVACV